ncbi:MAG: methionyl-tRNA formyltransferase, partial [Beijerinckiaceae bacterium]|nr:methionyl-tRNA formyltransferase [Beijerinckiaceae bacterium]
HASLLPRWRGAAPIQRAIMAGDSETGVMVMRMEEGLDEGPVALAGRVPIGPQANAGEITEKLAHLGAGLILRAFSVMEQGELVFTPQAAAGASYARKIGKDEARIDWRQPAKDLHNLVRGLAPSPVAYFEADLGNKLERVKVLRAELSEEKGTPGLVLDDRLTVACGEGSVRLLEVQRPGKLPMQAAEFLRGARIGKGAFLALAKNAAL